VVARTEAYVLAAPFPKGFLPLPLIFGSTTKAHAEKDRNPSKQPGPPHGFHPPPEQVYAACG